jgi:PAS domain-containing protein
MKRAGSLYNEALTSPCSLPDLDSWTGVSGCKKKRSNLSSLEAILKISIHIKFLIVLIIGLFTVFVVDPLDSTTVSAPFCLGIVLMALSLRQSVSLVVATSLLYSILTVYALVHFHDYIVTKVHVSQHPYFWLFQRMGLFLVLCGMAIYLAHYRSDTERRVTRLRTILSTLPVPVILSDSSGKIVYANNAVAPLLHHIDAPTVIGMSYFNFLMIERTKGESIRTYFGLFDADTNRVYEIEVGPVGRTTKMKAQLTCLGTKQNRILISVLHNIQTTPEYSASASQEASLPASFKTRVQNF